MRIRLSLLVLFPLMPALAGQADGWWDANWTARRPIEIARTGVGAADTETGWVEFRGMGRLASNGQDVRVVADGQPVSMKILFTGVDDRCVVAFRMPHEARHYFVYFGNPNAPQQTATWAPERGLWLETRAFGGGNAQTWDLMKRLLARSGPSHGAGPVRQVYRSGDAFSNEPKYVSLYTGVLNCTEAGVYTLCTDSCDASFLLMDGKMVVEAPGWHATDGRAKATARLDLAVGAHRFEYYHVCATGSGVAGAYWQTPKRTRFEVIPASAFAPVANGRAGALELNGATAVDFSIRLVDEAWVEDRALLRYRFQRRVPAEAGETRWTFGDGQTATGREVDHIYLREDLFEVTCTATVKGVSVAATSPCAIHADFERNPETQKGDARTFMKTVLAYAWDAMDVASLQAASSICETLEDTEGQIAIARALLRHSKIWDALYFEQAMQLQQLLREVKKAPDEALQVLTAAEDRVKTDKNLRAKILLEIGDVYYFDKHDLDRALLEYDKVVGRYTGLEDRIVRQTHIRIGDIMRDRGLYEKSAERYADAARIRVEKWSAVQLPMRQGAVLHSIEDFIRRGDPVQARKWMEIYEWEFPLERLRGQSALLRARIALLEKHPAEACKPLETLVHVNPESPYVGEALFLLAQFSLEAGETAKARELLNDLVEKHPESEMISKAQALLEQIANGGAVRANAPGAVAPAVPSDGEEAGKSESGSETTRRGKRRRENR